MIYLNLLLIFFKIGFFTIGGGYAMLPLMQYEIEMHNWITSQEFVDIIAIAEMTPGPISINAATFIGYRVGGVLGSLTATAGIILPSLLIILILSRVLERYRHHSIMKSIFAGVRPVVAGLIISAAWFIAVSVLIPIDSAGSVFYSLDKISLVLAALAFLAVRFSNVDPIKVIIAAGVIGFIIFK